LRIIKITVPFNSLLPENDNIKDTFDGIKITIDLAKNGKVSISSGILKKYLIKENKMST
jgi:hypothetical protein